VSALPLPLLYPGALVVFIIGLVLCLRRLLAGFALVSAAAATLVATLAYQQGWTVSVGQGISIGLILLLAVLGLSLEILSERLHLRLGWVGQNTVWAGLIGGMVGLFLFGGALWMLLGVLVGTIAVQFSGRAAGGVRLDRALLEGFEGFFAMFGSPGLRVLFAVVMIDLALNLVSPERVPLY
jgi:uncharacterized protein YqgC (DUF456 family)